MEQIILTLTVIRRLTYSLLLLFLFLPSLTHAAPAEFFYDAQGRLVGVKDETGKMAVHRYDAVGNLLAIDTFEPAADGIGIFLLHPDRGISRSEVKIEGFGFSTIPLENVVTFNGTPAVLSSSTSDSLTVIVPNGATTGPVVVTNTSGGATSPLPFTVIETPTVLGLDPPRVAQGTNNVMVVSGVNLSSVTGISFSTGSLTATLLTASTSNKIRIKLSVDAAALPGDYPFSLNTSAGTIPSGLVTVSVLPAEATFNIPLKGLSVFLPYPDSLAPSGPAMSAMQGTSVSMP